MANPTPTDVTVGSLWQSAVSPSPIKVLAVDGDDCLIGYPFDPDDCAWETRESIARLFETPRSSRPRCHAACRGRP